MSGEFAYIKKGIRVHKTSKNIRLGMLNLVKVFFHVAILL